MTLQLGVEAGPDTSGVLVERVRSMAAVPGILSAQASVNYPPRLFGQGLLDDRAVRIRAIYREGAFAAIGKMAIVGAAAYITDVMTMPEQRRRGLGEAIMRRLHRDAVEAGATHAVLTATAMAKPLYERLGYRDIGTVTLYATPERD
jgi:GNAT superfamily N-acetyltransferase